MQASKLGNLVGLHSTYLNDLEARYEGGSVPDLIEFLTQPWAELLHYDGFRGMREQLLGLAAAGLSGPQLLTESMQLLKERSSELHAYRAGFGLLDETLNSINKSPVMV